MDNEKTADVDAEGDDQSTQEFKEEVENDPSTAKPEDQDPDNVGHLRGG